MMTNILGLIPARGGSKGIPRKNLYPILGKPLIAYSIEAAQQSRLLTHVVVSTDDDEIADEANRMGARVPFMRPSEFAGDQSNAFGVIQHAVDFYRQSGIEFELLVYLQPTSPLRDAQMIDDCITLMMASDADSLVSVMDVPHQFSPDSQMQAHQGYVKPVTGKVGRLRRQEKTQYVARNGPAILITRPSTLIDTQSLYGERILSYKMNRLDSMDIDEADDIWLVEQASKRKQRNEEYSGE